MCTSRLTIVPTLLVARQRYTVLCTSCRYIAGGNGSIASVPFDMSCRRDGTSGTGVPSAVSQRTCGAGCPAAVQSIHAPVVFENSNLPGGSSKKDGLVKSTADVVDGDCDSSVAGEYDGDTINQHIIISEILKFLLRYKDIISCYTIFPMLLIEHLRFIL